MVISVDEKLEDLYNELKSMGYEVYKFGDNRASDVVIYSGKNNSFASLVNGGVPSNSGGAFLINGDNLRGEDVEIMIKNKAYSAIF